MAQLLSGKDVSKKVRERIKDDIIAIRAKQPSFRPGLAIVQVGDREDSNVYIRMKLQAAADVGIEAQHLKLPKETTQVQLLEKVRGLNADGKVNGIIVQLPLDTTSDIDSNHILDAIDPKKDVDGLTSYNAGRLAHGDLNETFIPCTPKGCLELIKETGVKIEGKRAVVLGRSKIVGSPVAELLKWHNATVTVCHSKTVDLPAVISEADILVVAIGRAEMVKGDWIKPGAIVIDCGINSITDDTKTSGKRLVGDVDFKHASERASWITPVPGGVGPMTVAMLLSNTLESAKKTSSL